MGNKLDHVKQDLEDWTEDVTEFKQELKQAWQEKKLKQFLSERVHKDSSSEYDDSGPEEERQGMEEEEGAPIFLNGEEGIDPVEHGAKLEDRFYNNKAFKKPDIDSGDPQQQEAAVKIQTKYRQHAATQEVQEMREDQAAIMIQSGYRGFQGRQRVLKMKDPEEYEKQKQARDARKKNKAGAAPSAEDTLQAEEEVDIDLTDPEVEKAATKIQEEKAEAAATEALKEPEPAAKTEEEEEIDIDLNDPEVEKAATKIQAGFKGFKARKEVEAKKSEAGAASSGATPTAEAEATPADTEAPPAEEKKEEEEEIDIDLEDPEVEKAATKIQAGFKGLKARKEVAAMKKESEPDTSQTTEGEGQGEGQGEGPTEGEKPAEGEKKPEEEEEIDIDLNDPEVGKAATKIQAGFRGMQARKEVATKKTSETAAEEGEKATEEQPPADVAPAEEQPAEQQPAEETAAEQQPTEETPADAATEETG